MLPDRASFREGVACQYRKVGAVLGIAHRAVADGFGSLAPRVVRECLACRIVGWMLECRPLRVESTGREIEDLPDREACRERFPSSNGKRGPPPTLPIIRSRPFEPNLDAEGWNVSMDRV